MPGDQGFALAALAAQAAQDATCSRATVRSTHVSITVGKHGLLQEKRLVIYGVCWTSGACAGGYTAASRAVVDILRQRARPYLFSNTVRWATHARLLPALLAIRRLCSKRSICPGLRADSTNEWRVPPASEAAGGLTDTCRSNLPHHCLPALLVMATACRWGCSLYFNVST